MADSSSPVRLQEAPFSADAEIAALKAASKSIGGIALFLGCARDFSEGRQVAELSFECYEKMALAELHKLRQEAIDRFGLVEARIVHRIAAIAAGDDIVLVAAGAAHRAEAFAACRFLIDELKARVPIWKKETTLEGESWVSAHP
jgi:molybdopterin synthase catalytic subunit